jgi:hypothetical protein
MAQCGYEVDSSGEAPSLTVQTTLRLSEAQVQQIDPPSLPRQVTIYVDGEYLTYPELFGGIQHRVAPGSSRIHSEFIVVCSTSE